MLAALFGAIAWNLLTWRLGLPSSSTHALIGGLIGAAIVQSGLARRAVVRHLEKVADPGRRVAGDRLRVAFVLVLAIFWVFVVDDAGRRQPELQAGQIGSGTWVAFTHGANDAQKTMGVITLALVHERSPCRSSTFRTG